MAKNKDYRPEDIAFPDQVIVESELVKEMKDSYIDYAVSVIVGRALPDVRDGLKPVHRRILYSMYESGLTSDKPFKKSATCVGDVLGKYHPHGDSSVYDALVRLAQDFSMRYRLIDGHGNFGSVDGDPPAAYRYTEARMAKMAGEMLADIEKETVDWDPNFDESRREPRVLPARFPNLLVNGSSGIAVGMATNIPPHNLREVIDAAVEVVNLILGEERWPFEFLVENQWWPGFTFTEPEETARLLEGIRFAGKGILLDTGHLMNACTELKTEAEGADYIRRMLNRHGSLAKWVRGVHLHQSLSGAYVKAHTGSLPAGLPEDYMERFGVSYQHILQIDQHRPWTDPAILSVLEQIEPRYLTHELSSRGRMARAEAVSVQTRLLQQGGRMRV